MNELVTIGIAKSEDEVDALVSQGQEWIDLDKQRRHPCLDLFGDEWKKCAQELMNAEQLLKDHNGRRGDTAWALQRHSNSLAVVLQPGLQ